MEISNTRTPEPDYQVTVFGSTNVGIVRSHNEDNFLVCDLTAGLCSLQPEVRHHRVGPRGSLFMVADGMGGGAAGEVASQLAINTVYERLLEGVRASETLDKREFAHKLKESVEQTNKVIFQESRNNPDYKGMGTTTSAAGYLAGTLFLAQVGDSRAYLVRRNVIKQITKDQSLVNKLLDAGLITEEEAESHENKNVILQALGVSESVDVVLSSIDVCQNDALVLCSDGLSGLVKAEEIRQVVDNYCDEVEACRRLIDMANERGGYDNITVIVARFIGESLPMASEEDLVQYKLFDDSEEETTKLQGLPVTLPAEKKNDLTASPSSTSKFLLLSIVFVALATAVVALRIALRTPPSAGVSVAQSAQESKRPEVPLPTQPTDTVPIAQPPLPTASPAPDNRPLATAVGEGKAIAKAAAEMLVQEIRKNRPLIKKPGGAAAKPENAQQSVPKADGPPGPKPSTFEENSSKAIGRNIQNPQPGPPAGKHPEGQQDINEAGKAQPSVAETVPEGGEKAISGIKVEVVTEPAGLSFSVDGEELLRKTPSEFQLTPGKHKIRFRFGPILIVKEVEVLLEGKNRFDFLIDSTAPTTTVPPHS